MRLLWIPTKYMESSDEYKLEKIHKKTGIYTCFFEYE
jgi:hypothetical protein